MSLRHVANGLIFAKVQMKGFHCHMKLDEITTENIMTILAIL